MTIQTLICAWTVAGDSGDMAPGATEEELRAVEAQIGVLLPPALRALYRATNGAYLLDGNLRLYPLQAPEGEFSLVAASDMLRQWDWTVPTEILVFGDDGQGDSFGIWLPQTPDDRYDHPVVEIGEIFEPGCMAVVGTSLDRFLLAWSAYYLLLEEAPASALDAIGFPRDLWADELMHGEHHAWADPGLPDRAPDPYVQRYDVHDLHRQFGG
jgi:hypothetical protein